MTDISRKKINRKKQQLDKVTNSILMNYLGAKTLEGQKSQLSNLKYHLEKRKKTSTYNINDDIGFTINLNNFGYNYFCDLVLHLDDLDLFLMLKDLGLSDIVPQGKPLWHNMIYFSSHRCFSSYFCNTPIDIYFTAGELNPLHYAISTYNQPAFNTIMSHPEFKLSYLEYVNKAKSKNALALAAAAFNLEAVDALLKLKAPCLTVNNMTSAFDHAVMKFLDYFSNNKVTQFFRTQEGMPCPLVSPEKSSGLKKAMNIETIREVFYLLLNKTPHDLNIHQLYSILPNEKKLDLFERLEELHENHIHFSRGSFKILLDILLSAGPGLCFYDLPISLQKIYVTIPDDAEICMPIMSKNQEIKYIYKYKDFEGYLLANRENFIPLASLYQYINNKLKRPDLNSNTTHSLSALEEIIMGSKNIHEITVCIVRPKVNDFVREEGLTPVEMFKKIDQVKLISFNKETLSALMKEEINPLNRIEANLVGDEFYQINEDNLKIVRSAMLDTSSTLPTLFIHLLRCNEIFRQLPNREVYFDDLMTVKKTILVFERICSKIDFYVLVSLYHHWKIIKRSPGELIEYLNALLVPIKILNKKINLMDSERYLPAFLRAQYFIYGLLIEAHCNNNQPRLAKKALREVMLVSQSAADSDFFKDIYHNLAHHIVTVQIFSIVLEFGFQYLKPKEIYKHFSQVLNYESGIVLQKSFCQKLTEYILNCIHANLFTHVEKLLILLQKHVLNENMLPLVELEKLYIVQVGLYLNKIDAKLLKSDFSVRFKLDVEKSTLEIDCSEISFSLKHIQKRIPIECKALNKNLILEEIHLYAMDDVEDFFQALDNIFSLDLKKKQKQIDIEKSKTTDPSFAKTDIEMANNMSCLMLYESNVKTYNRTKKIKKDILEPKSIFENPIKIVKQSDIIINRAELKKVTNIGNEFSDLIMITSPYGKIRFVVIKKSTEFNCFFEACHHFENKQGEWGVKSVNPYGSNQHGVKLYDNKVDDKNKKESVQSNIKTEKYVIKIKGSGSDRAVGIGREVEYLGKKIIIYQVDTILTHKKADKVLKF